MKVLVFIFMFAGQVSGQTCAEIADYTDLSRSLVAGLQSAENEQSASAFSDQLWKIWTKAPDREAQALLDKGLLEHRYGDFDAAVQSFTELIEYCPEYAEGYNQRAFVYFLSGKFDVALADLDLAIERSPLHIAVLSGKALTLFKLGRYDEGQNVLQHAVDLNPWLSERVLLKDASGQDI